MRRIKAQDPLGAARVKPAVILPRLPKRPIELALHEPQFLRGDLCVCDECPVVGYEGFEFSAEVAALDPVYHEPAVGGACGDTVFCVDVGEFVADVFPAFDEVFVGCAACR